VTEYRYVFGVLGYRHDVMVRVRAENPDRARKIVQEYAQRVFGELYNRKRGVWRFLGERRAA
jgi:hypothetical protein